MTLGLVVVGLVSGALAAPSIISAARSALASRRQSRARRHDVGSLADPGRERRAEQRARELLRSCVNGEEWAMYRDLGFIRVRGGLAGADGVDADYAYLIYPHKPIVAFVPSSGRLLSEYCVQFPDLSGGRDGSRLPPSDDVLAKWMALTGDERRLVADANMHLPGRQVDPGRMRRDLWRLTEWERRRECSDAGRAA